MDREVESLKSGPPERQLDGHTGHAHDPVEGFLVHAKREVKVAADQEDVSYDVKASPVGNVVVVLGRSEASAEVAMGVDGIVVVLLHEDSAEMLVAFDCVQNTAVVEFW